jgi:hypothetical protein
MSDNKLPRPNLPQKLDGIIDESSLDQPVLVVIVKKYATIHIDDQITVRLNDYISSRTYFITNDNIDYPEHELTVPFSTIPLGSYDVFYTILDWSKNPSDSESNHVKIIKSDSPSPTVYHDAILTITGYQAIGNEYEILTIQLNDKETSEQIKNTNVSCILEQTENVNIITEIDSNPDTIQPMKTNEFGQFQINFQGQNGGSCTIKVTTEKYIGSVNHTIGQI